MHKELLLEIGTEEIPSRFAAGAMSQLKESVSKLLSAQRLEHGEVRTYSTPRRLCLVVSELIAEQPDELQTFTGPPVAAAYKNGEATKALLGFAKARGATLDDVKEVDGPKGKVVAVEVMQHGQPAMSLLPAIMAEVVGGLRFPKSMRWRSGDTFRFARPIRWLCCVFGGEVVPFEVTGLKAGDGSFGHRFIAPRRFKAKDFESYRDELKQSYVILDQEKRRQLIREHAEKLSGEATLLLDDELLETLTHLVEHPLVLEGAFDESFLEVPSAVIVSAMKGHQKYIPLQSPDGKLMNRFILVSNNLNDDKGLIVKGNERVLAARLSDAQFFFREDQKRTLADRLPDLERVVFHKSLGTVREKVGRIVSLVPALADAVDRIVSSDELQRARRTALLCKGDLVSLMVFEFPELQGQMGAAYARNDGEAPEVAAAIEEHYLPRFREDAIPQSTEGLLVSLADRFDSLTGIFATGYKPKGNEDPFALRRITLGILRILQEHNLRVSLPDIIDGALMLHEENLGEIDESVAETVFAYILGRLKNDLLGEGIPGDVADAIFSGECSDAVDARQRVLALQQHSADREAFEPVIVVLKRVMNIIPEGFSPGEVDAARLEEATETALWEEFQRRSPNFETALAEERYGSFLSETVAMKPAIDGFFDTVMVNCEDEALRTNRLNLLHAIGSMLKRFADFTKLN